MRASSYGLGALLLVATAWQHVLATRPGPSAPEFVVSQLVAGAVYLLAVGLVVRRPEAVSFRYVLLIGVLCRLILLPTPPLFDDDVHRYVWEGKVVAHGGNPFLYPPLAPELAPLRDENWAQVGYPEVRTIYPPLAQYLFALPHVIGLGSAVGLKVLFFPFDVGCMLLVAALLAQTGRPRTWALLYAWSPLATKEFANSGHLEPAMLFFLLLALYLARTRRAWAGLPFGAALSVKPVPLLLAPLLWRRGGRQPVILGLALLALLYLPFLGAGRLLFSGSGLYAQHWTFNYGAFGLLAGLLPRDLARLLAAALVLAFAVWRAARVRSDRLEEVLPAARDSLAVCVLLSPTVDPWYVCWLLPFLAVAPNAGLLLFTVTCNLSYLYYAHGTFPVWISLLEYLPVYALFVVSGLQSRHKVRSALRSSASSASLR